MCSRLTFLGNVLSYYLSVPYMLIIEVFIFENTLFAFICAELLKNIFLDVKKKFETAIGVLRQEKITIDPEDPAAVSHYATVMKTVREK